MGLLAAVTQYTDNTRVTNNEYTNMTVSINCSLRDVQEICQHLDQHKSALGIFGFIVCDNDLRTLLAEKKVGLFAYLLLVVRCLAFNLKHFV